MKPKNKKPTQQELGLIYYVEEISIAYKYKIPPSQRQQITSSQDAFRIFKQSWNTNTIDLQEEFKILLLNRANKVIGLVSISTGGVAGTIADPKMIFAVALKSLASSIIICHNHPSGNLKPSKADEQLTHRLVEGGKLLDVLVYDSMIITSEGYLSFADEGML